MSPLLSKILFIDDDELIGQFVVLVMQMEGVDVLHCLSGAVALEKAACFNPDLMMLDVQMPEMDGIETFFALKRIPELQSTPVIFLTGSATDEEIKKYQSMGALGVIAKPFDAKSLHKTVCTIWDQQ